MSIQLRGRRSGPLWSFLFLLTITALAIGYFLGAQRSGAPVAQIALTRTLTPAASVAVAFVTTIETPTAATPDLAAVQTVVAAQLATAMAATLTAQPTPDQAATATSVAAQLNTVVAATLTAQPTATQTPQPTNSATATSSGIGSNPLLVAAPELVAPESDYTIIGNVETIFAWKWAGTLAPNQGFEIIFWPLGQPSDKRGIHDARETQTLTPSPNGIYRFSKKIPNQDPGNYEWTVAIVQLDSYQILVEASSRPINIVSSSGNNNATSTRVP